MSQHQNPFVLSFLAFFLAFFCHCSATTFTVGDSAGWIIPPYPAYYSNWSNSNFVRAGDSVGKSLIRNVLLYLEDYVFDIWTTLRYSFLGTVCVVFHQNQSFISAIYIIKHCYTNYRGKTPILIKKQYNQQLVPKELYLSFILYIFMLQIGT